MQITSSLQESIDEKGEPIAIWALHLDTQETNTEKDFSYSAIPFYLIYDKDPEVILNLIIPMISELIYKAYGKEIENKKPITSIHATGFDPSCVNGVKGAKIS